MDEPRASFPATNFQHYKHKDCADHLKLKAQLLKVHQLWSQNSSLIYNNRTYSIATGSWKKRHNASLKLWASWRTKLYQTLGQVTIGE